MGLYLFSALIFWQKMWGEGRLELKLIGFLLYPSWVVFMFSVTFAIPKWNRRDV